MYFCGWWTKDVFTPSAKVDNVHLVQPPLPPKVFFMGIHLKKQREIFYLSAKVPAVAGMGVVITFDLWVQEGPAFSRGLSGYWQRSDMIDRLMRPPSSEGPLCLSGSDVFPELTSHIPVWPGRVLGFCETREKHRSSSALDRVPVQTLGNQTPE